MEEMVFSSCKAVRDVWIRTALKSNGVECYQHVLLYTDDILAIMEEPETFLREELGKRSLSELKNSTLGTKFRLLHMRMVSSVGALVHLSTFKLL